MGYRSHVRSLIYGDPDKIDVLVAKHSLLSRDGDYVLEEVRVYDIKRSLFDYEASAELGPDPDNGRTQTVFNDKVYRCIDLDAQEWKWDSSYPGVRFWLDLMAEASELELNTELVRIGENTDDIVETSNIWDDGDSLIGVSRSIYADIPEIEVESAAKPVCEGA